MEEAQSKLGDTKSLPRAKETLEAVDPEFREYLARVEKQRQEAAKAQPQNPKPERKPVLVPKKKEQMPAPAPAKRKDDHEMEI